MEERLEDFCGFGGVEPGRVIPVPAGDGSFDGAGGEGFGSSFGDHGVHTPGDGVAATGHRDGYLPALAMSVNKLAVRLGEAGRRGEGLAAAQEAVDLYRVLAGENRDAYLPDLAGAVNNLAIRLAEAGRRAEGMAAAQEAVDLYRELASDNRDA